MLKLISIVAIVILLSDTSLAAMADDAKGLRLQMGLGSQRVESAARNRQVSSSVLLSAGIPLYQGWRSDLLLIITPDNNRSSRRVRVDEDHYTIAPLIGWSYPYFFRFNLAGGPTIIHNRTRIALDRDSEQFTSTLIGYMGLAAMDYAVNPNWEISVLAGFIERPEDKKRDYLLGVQVGYNFFKDSDRQAQSISKWD